MDVAKEVARLKRECAELGIAQQELCRMVKVKPGLITSWACRSRGDPKYRPRESILLHMNSKLEELRRKKADEAGLKVAKQPQFNFDDEAKEVVNTALNKRPTACQVLSDIIREKISGMSLVQLAMLLAHVESNGK